MKREIKKIIIALLAFALSSGQMQAQPNYFVTVNSNVIPPVSPYFNQMLSGVAGRINVQLTYIDRTSGPQSVKIVGSISCLSPTPFTISLNPSYMPLQPIVLQPRQTLQLTNNLLQQSFGNFTENNLSFSGISLAGIKDGVNYKLPEGIYKLCFVVYQYQNGVTGPAVSDPNTGCTTFSVCYKAGAPQFVTPVNGISASSEITTVNPNSPLVFTWTPPSITCGVMPGGISYDLEIRPLMQGQTVTDAIRNPYVFQKKGLPSSTFILDTILYKNILTRGSQYVIRVKANNNIAGPAPVEIDNLGYSRVEAFQYGSNLASQVAAHYPGGLEGTILIPDTAAMKGVLGADCFEKDIFRVELWRVAYQSTSGDLVQGKPAVRMYLLQKAGDVKTTYTKAPGEVRFAMTNLPDDTASYVVLAYSSDASMSAYPPVYISGNPDDGSGRPFASVRYLSNTKMQIGMDKMYGIYSIQKTTNLHHIQFSASSLNSTTMNTMSFWTDVGDFFGTVAKDVGTALSKAEGAIANSVGNLLLQLVMGTYDAVVYGNLPKYRAMTQAEYDWANQQVFNGHLPSRGTITITNLMAPDHRCFTVPDGHGRIVMNMGDEYDDPVHYGGGGLIPGEIFIHEMTHCWQIGQSAQLQAFGQGISNQWKYSVLGERSVYDYKCGGGWSGYNYEQQAMINQNCYHDRQELAIEKPCPFVDTICEEPYIVKFIRLGVPFPPAAPDYVQIVQKTPQPVHGSGYLYAYVQVPDAFTLKAGKTLTDAFDISWTGVPYAKEIFCSGKEFMIGTIQAGRLESVTILPPGTSEVTDCCTQDETLETAGLAQYEPKRCRTITTQPGYQTVAFKISDFPCAFSYYVSPSISVKQGYFQESIPRPAGPSTQAAGYLWEASLFNPDPGEPYIYEVKLNWQYENFSNYKLINQSPILQKNQVIGKVLNVNIGNTKVSPHIVLPVMQR